MQLTTRNGELYDIKGSRIDEATASNQARIRGFNNVADMMADLNARQSGDTFADFIERVGPSVRKLIEAKKVETKAKENRIAAEEEVAALIETADRGSATADVGDGMKVTVTRDMTYTVDVLAVRALDVPDLPLKFIEAVPAGYTFDPTAYEKLRESAPESFAKIAQLVTTKPRKTSVTVKVA